VLKNRHSAYVAEYAAPVILNQVTYQLRIRIIFWCVAIAFGFVQAWTSRYTMQADGISYLDMGEALWRADWKMAINGCWSPLYPGLIGLVMVILKPAARWEFTLAHLMNFAIYVSALGCFDFFLRGLVADERVSDSSENGVVALPRWALLTLGYTLFIWSSLTLITLEKVSPDMLMAAFVYLAVGIILRIRKGYANWRAFAVLGIVLGFGYLAKAPMFPLAFVFLAVPLGLLRNNRRGVPLVLLGFLVFLLVGSAYIIALSKSKDRLTFGDSGRLNYLYHVNRASPSWYWQDPGSAGGHFVHSPRKLLDSPPIYEFASPVKGTQPVWYDPSYWSEGAVPRVHIREQLIVVRKHVEMYLEMLFSAQTQIFCPCPGGPHAGQQTLLVGFVALCLMSGRKWQFLRGVAGEWPVWLPAIVALGMYSLVHVEPRYAAVFLILIWMSLFSALRLPAGEQWRKLVTAVTLSMVIVIGGSLALSAVYDLIGSFHRRNAEWEIAEGLHRMGVEPGDKVARIGGRLSADWARLLRVKVVAEIPLYAAGNFWSATPSVQAQVIDAFNKSGARVIVAQEMRLVQSFNPSPGWQPVGDSGLYAFMLDHGMDHVTLHQPISRKTGTTDKRNSFAVEQFGGHLPLRSLHAAPSDQLPAHWADRFGAVIRPLSARTKQRLHWPIVCGCKPQLGRGRQ
jgi:hypothetical protein